MIVKRPSSRYPGGMNANALSPTQLNTFSIQELRPGKCCLLLATRRHAAEIFAHLAAQQALRGPVKLLDGGNSLDVYRLARELRSETADLDQALMRITTARAFTCYQMTTLLSNALIWQGRSTQPVLVLNLLDTFGDENVRLEERQRLLAECLHHLQRLSIHAPVAVSADPAQPLTQQLYQVVATVFDATDPPPGSLQPRLF
jgi:hypothetical protein